MSMQAFGGVASAPIPQPPFAATPVVYYTATAPEVAALAAAGTPVPPGAMLIDPTSRLIYGQSDGVGGYQALGGAFDVASQAEAEGGTNNAKGMTPLRARQASAFAPISGVVYTNGRITQWVEGGVTYTATYNANGSFNTVSDGTTTRTVTYNGDGSFATFA